MGPQFKVIMLPIGSADISVIDMTFYTKEEAVEYIDSIDDKCILVSGYDLDFENHC